MPTAVERITVHHQGDGLPKDGTWDNSEPYCVLVGRTKLTWVQAPWTAWATKGFNHVSFDICLSGNRMVVPLTDNDLRLIAEACEEARRRGWLSPTAVTYPHGTLYPPPLPYPSGSSPTQCPGIDTIARWRPLVAATRIKVGDPLPGSATAIAVRVCGTGYYVFSSTGKVYAYGCKYLGGLVQTTPTNPLDVEVQLAKPIVDAAVTSDGLGYYMVGGDGGLFAFGSAKFLGSPAGVLT